MDHQIASFVLMATCGAFFCLLWKTRFLGPFGKLKETMHK
jgi:hypothetical protein